MKHHVLGLALTCPAGSAAAQTCGGTYRSQPGDRPQGAAARRPGAPAAADLPRGGNPGLPAGRPTCRRG